MKIITPKTKDQISAAKKLAASTFKDIGLKSSDMDVYFNSDKFLSYVAVDNNSVVGFASANIAHGFFYWLAVSPKHRRKGIGQSLVTKIEQDFKKKKTKTISLESRNRYKPAIMMYLKNGYDIKGSFVEPAGDLLIRLSKKL